MYVCMYMHMYIHVYTYTSHYVPWQCLYIALCIHRRLYTQCTYTLYGLQCICIAVCIHCSVYAMECVYIAPCTHPHYLHLCEHGSRASRCVHITSHPVCASHSTYTTILCDRSLLLRMRHCGSMSAHMSAPMPTRQHVTPRVRQPHRRR